MTAASTSYDVVIAGGGIVGACCALSCAQAGMRVALVERDCLGSGATAAGMGHIVVMDDSEAQFALTRRSQQLWQALAPTLPASAEYEAPGTLWVAADEEELAEAQRKQTWLAERNVPSQLLTSQQLTNLEPNLRPGLAGALLVEQDAVVYPPVVALHLARQAQSLGAMLFIGHSVIRMGDGRATLDDGTRLHAPRLVNALGAESPRLTPGIPVRKRKGHLAITDRYPGFVRHQLVELGYLKSAHSVSSDSVAFNVQPRKTGQVLIGSSRQYGNESSSVDQPMLTAMLERAQLYMPALASLNVLRIWTGFRAATPDKLPLIGPIQHDPVGHDPVGHSPAQHDPTIWLATGHEGLGITTAPATAELLVSHFTGKPQAILAEPYLPSRFGTDAQREDAHHPPATITHPEQIARQ